MGTVVTTDAAGGEGWDYRRRRKVVEKILKAQRNESQQDGLSPVLPWVSVREASGADDVHL
jgi:hypothetical protein